MRSQRSRRVLGALVICCLVLLGSGASAGAVGRPGHGLVSFGPVGPTTGPAPFQGTIEPSIAAAEAALGQHIPRPHMCAAQDRNAWSVVVDLRNRDVAITYRTVRDSGRCIGFSGGRVQVVVSLRGRFYANVRPLATQASGEARSMGRVASVVWVRGIPAVVLQGDYPGDCDEPPAPGQQGCASAQQNPTALIFQFGRADIQMYGPPWWLPPQLVSVASSLS